MSDADKLFNTLFDDGATQSNVVPLNRDQQAAEQPAADTTASATAAAADEELHPREWYIVLNGVQIGPLIQAEIEERWATREINKESLIWKPGMSDWVSIGSRSQPPCGTTRLRLRKSCRPVGPSRLFLAPVR